MIHVCSLARLYATVDETGARHIVTLLRLTDRITWYWQSTTSPRRSRAILRRVTNTC